MTRQELDALYAKEQKVWAQPQKSKQCSLVLILMDSDLFANNYCGSLREVLREYPETDRETLEKELDRYI